MSYNGISPPQPRCVLGTPSHLEAPVASGRGGESNPLLPDFLKMFYEEIAWDLFDDRRFKLPPYTLEHGRVVGPVWKYIELRFDDMDRLDMFSQEKLNAIKTERTRRDSFLASMHRCETARLSARHPAVPERKA